MNPETYDDFVSQLIARTSVLRAQAHGAHLATGSYSKHKALNNFYEDITDVMDEVVECSRGLDAPYNPQDVIGGNVSFMFVDDVDIVQTMEDYEDFIEQFIAFIDNEEDNGNVEHCFIANLLQDQQALLTRTIFKLTCLS